MTLSIRVAIFAAIAFATTACSTVHAISGIKNEESASTVSQRQFLIGVWETTSKLPGGGLQKSTMQRNEDGTFKIAFEFSGSSDLPAEQVEVGRWGVSGGVYFTITTGFIEHGETFAADQTDPTYYDAYRIISLDNRKFEYQQFSTTNRFTSFKVVPLGRAAP